MKKQHRRKGIAKACGILLFTTCTLMFRIQSAFAAFQSEESDFAAQYYRVAFEESGSMMVLAILMLLGGGLYVIWRFLIVFLARIPFVRSMYDSLIPENEPGVSLKTISGKGEKSDNAVSTQES